MILKVMRYESTSLNGTVGDNFRWNPGFTKHTTHVFLIPNMNCTPILLCLAWKFTAAGVAGSRKDSRFFEIFMQNDSLKMPRFS